MRVALIGGRITTLVVIATSFVLSSCARPVPSPSPQPEKLNVLFILVDDLNTRLGTYGDPVVQTPNIDRLASMGVQFNRAFNQYPMCNASRTSLLSGLYPETTGVFSNADRLPPELGEMALLPEYFRYHGYYAEGFGKIAHRSGTVSWGQPIEGDPVPPKEVIRQLSRAASEGITSLEEDEELEPSIASYQALYPSGSPIRGSGAKDGAVLRDEKTATNAIRWLEENQEKPFFLAVGFNSTHLPFHAPQSYLRRYPPYTIQLRREPPGHLAAVPSIALTRHSSDAMNDREHRVAIARYFSCVSYVDDQVGRLLEALERLDLQQRTVVVLTSDHGFLLGEHENHWRKGTLFLESSRVPLIIAGPQISAGKPTGQPVELVDLYPTLVELSGLPQPQGLQGSSLVDLLRDPMTSRKRPAYTIVARSRDRRLMGRSIHTSRYRYTEWGGKNRAELYDLWVDPFEYRNLVAQRGRHRKQLKSLRKQLRKSINRATASRSPRKRS